MPEFSLPHLRHIPSQAFVLDVTGQDTGTTDLMLAELGNPDGVGGPTGGVGDPQAGWGTHRQGGGSTGFLQISRQLTTRG